MKRKSITIGLAVLLITSCASENYQSSNEQVEKQQVELQNVFNKIDSVNNYYTYSSDTILSRGFGNWYKQHVTYSAADNIGRIAGGWIGKHAGASLGVATANPVVGVAGYVAGRYVGGAVGSVAASYMAFRVLNRLFTRGNVDDLKQISVNDYILTEETKEKLLSHINKDSISIGDIHNIILVKIIENGDKYMNADNTFNYSLLLDDCAAYAEEIVPNRYDASTINDIKDILIEQTKSIQSSVVDFKSEGLTTTEEFYQKSFDKLKDHIYVDKNSFDRQAKINCMLGKTYFNLNDIELKECEKSIDNIIKCSELDTEIKRELQNSNSIVANSTFLWRTIKQ